MGQPPHAPPGLGRLLSVLPRAKEAIMPSTNKEIGQFIDFVQFSPKDKLQATRGAIQAEMQRRQSTS